MGQAIVQGENLAHKIINLIKYLLVIKMMLSHCYCSSSFWSHQSHKIFPQENVKHESTE